MTRLQGSLLIIFISLVIFEGYRTRQWFQQDGATPHTAKQTLTWLEDRFHGRIISLKTEQPWPPHSPDLTERWTLMVVQLKEIDFHPLDA